MEYVGFEEIRVYILKRQDTVAQYICDITYSVPLQEVGAEDGVLGLLEVVGARGA